MKLPRDTDARELIKALQRIGYQVVRQSGSHIRLRLILRGLVGLVFEVVEKVDCRACYV